MEEKITIIIAEDHTIVREGLRCLISTHPKYKVVGEARDGLEAIRCVGNLKPDLVLMDLSMPRMNGTVATQEIKRRFRHTKVLVLTVHKTEGYILEAFQAGTDGYCTKDATHQELMMAIESVLSGKSYVDPEISNKLLSGYLEGKTGTPNSGSSFQSLTSREKQVLKLIGEGYKNREISGYLFISVKTVEKHRSLIMQKLDIHNAVGLQSYAIKKGLVVK